MMNLYNHMLRWLAPTGFSQGTLPGRIIRGYLLPVGPSWKKRGRIHIKKRGKRYLMIDNQTGEVEVSWRSPKKNGRLMKNSKYNRQAS